MAPPVLVTGSNRSGTTWVGDALCQSDELTYLHEPFNSSIWPRLLDVELSGHYTYVTEENEARYIEPVARLLSYRFPFRSQLREVDSPRNALRLGRDLARSELRRRQRRRPLLKDPIALFATEWLAERFGVVPVVMIRHPAAFASSIKRLRWSFDFSYWLRQDLLMRDLLGAFRNDLERAVAQPLDHLDQAVLLWRVFYDVVDQLRRRHDDWHFVLYEELADDPLRGFQRLYAELGLRWDRDVAGRVGAFSSEGNVKEVAAAEKGTTRRDSAAAKSTWTTRLTSEEIERVRRGVADVSERFYDPSDWPAPAPSKDT